MNYNQQRIICTVDNGIIYEISTTNECNAIGHVNARFDEVLSIANEYKQLGIKHGYIEVEKTQAEIMQEMLATIKDLKTEVEGLKNDKQLDNASKQDVKRKRERTETSEQQSTSLLIVS